MCGIDSRGRSDSRRRVRAFRGGGKEGKYKWDRLFFQFLMLQMFGQKISDSCSTSYLEATAAAAAELIKIHDDTFSELNYRDIKR